MDNHGVDRSGADTSEGDFAGLGVELVDDALASGEEQDFCLGGCGGRDRESRDGEGSE